ncbi:MAG: hypothetical protein GZ090_03870 [Oxalobacteraceae bacterium]|nr:hypothetical protein [Oxalobacteraceae bacterium]
MIVLLNSFSLRRALRLALLVAGAGLASACSVFYPAASVEAPLPPSGLRLNWPSGSIVTVELAAQALNDAAARRVTIEQTDLRAQAVCFDKFFMTACNDRGREQRRIALAEVRSVEVEANYINRRDRADQRDKALEIRTVQEQAEAPQRLQDMRDREKAATIKAADRAANTVKAQGSQQRDATIDPQARQRAFDAKAARQQASEQAGQAQRAANMSAFDKKQADAAARQKQVAERKARKLAGEEEKAMALKAANEKAAADAAAAAAKQ